MSDRGYESLIFQDLAFNPCRSVYATAQRTPPGFSGDLEYLKFREITEELGNSASSTPAWQF